MGAKYSWTGIPPMNPIIWVHVCKKCGALVFNQELHDQFHREVDRVPPE